MTKALPGRPDERKLPSPGQTCVQPTHYGLRRQLQSRTQAPWPVMCFTYFHSWIWWAPAFGVSLFEALGRGQLQVPLLEASLFGGEGGTLEFT